MTDSPWTTVEAAVARADDFLLSLRAHGREGAFRTSLVHDPARWPGVLLPGSYDALMALRLTGGLDRLSPAERDAAARFLKTFRGADGSFRNPQHTPESTFKRPEREETDRYIQFHLGNYSLGALEALGDAEPPVLDFVRWALDPAAVDAWLARRDMRDPWLEGNNIVNLASFLLLFARRGGADEAAAHASLRRLVDWHHFNQEPATGFWGVGQTHTPAGHLHAMAGATHNFHLFYALGEPIAHHRAIVDYCLTLPTSIMSACIDVDAVDILANFLILHDYRRADIRAWLSAKLAAVLAFQGPDGGFSDLRDGVRRLDGWIGGYEEPQGISNAFGTYFRLIAVAMIATVLWPGRHPWRFRRMIGIGYFPDHQSSP